jgi:alpha-L-glutamate ligase-like protein
MKRDFRKLAGIMGINRRNLEMIYPHNPRSGFPAVDDKVRTKELLAGAGVPVPDTIAVVTGFLQARDTVQRLHDVSTFVVKPARGRGGGGVLILEGAEDGWRTPSGRDVEDGELLQHFGDILFGVYSFGRADDAALVEQRVRPHDFFTAIHRRGIPDIRIILFRERPVMAMLRIPTDASDGRANLHQGAIGVSVDLATGRTGTGSLRGSPVDRHPDSDAPVAGLSIPFWDRIVSYAVAAAGAVPLKYVGVDLVIDAERGPLMLEVNARPGLQIQVINRTGLVPILTEAAR